MNKLRCLFYLQADQDNVPPIDNLFMSATTMNDITQLMSEIVGFIWVYLAHELVADIHTLNILLY